MQYNNGQCNAMLTDKISTQVVEKHMSMINIIISISGVQTQPWTTTTNAATQTDDYVHINEKVEIQSGATTGSVTITVVDDNRVEPQDGASTNELFQLVLYPDDSQDACVLEGNDRDKATIEIQDNDCK